MTGIWRSASSARPPTLGPVSSFDARPAHTSPTGSAAPATAEAAFVGASESESVDVLPTMGDLDRLAADLDRVDSTLVEIDGPAQLPSS